MQVPFRLIPGKDTTKDPNLDNYRVEIEHHSPKDGEHVITAHNLHQITNGKKSGKFFVSAGIEENLQSN